MKFETTFGYKGQMFVAEWYGPDSRFAPELYKIVDGKRIDFDAELDAEGIEYEQGFRDAAELSRREYLFDSGWIDSRDEWERVRDVRAERRYETESHSW